jgi:hypothetical protein
MLAGCGTERASLLVTSVPVPRSLLNKKEERRSKQSRANLSIFSFPPNYIVLYCIVLCCNYFSSPFLRQPVTSMIISTVTRAEVETC